MAWWFSFNGTNSADMGVIVKEMPVIPRAERRAERIAIPGRDGHVTRGDDTYAPVDIVITCVIETTDKINEISDWLRGSGDLVLSLEPDKAYKAEAFAPFGYGRLAKTWREFPVTFTAQPFRYEAEPETISLTASGTIYNPGTRFSLPVIDVYGSGVLTIQDGENTYEITVTATSGEDYVTINSEMQECYYGSAWRNSNVSGTFPKLQPGEITVTLGTGITRADITGNWRWY